MVTEPFSVDFVDKYIGRDNIENFKKSQIYQDYYGVLIQNEERLPSVLDVVKIQYIDRGKINEILSQKHLLNRADLVAVLISSFSPKVTIIYCGELGLIFYFTNIKSVRKRTGFSSEDLKKIKKSNFNPNTKYDEAYLTYIIIDDEDYFIEHNNEFNEVELRKLKGIDL